MALAKYKGFIPGQKLPAENVNSIDPDNIEADLADEAYNLVRLNGTGNIPGEFIPTELLLLDEAGFTAFVENATKMALLVEAPLGLSLVFANSAFLAILIASTVGMSAVANSSTAMNIIADDTAILALFMADYGAREAFWDSDVAPAILMDAGNASRAWLKSNATTRSGGANDWTSVTTKKVFVLEFSRQYPSSEFGIRYENGTGVYTNPATAVTQISVKAVPFEIRHSYNASNTGTTYVQYIVMEA